jgi:hypothetical protein
MRSRMTRGAWVLLALGVLGTGVGEVRAQVGPTGGMAGTSGTASAANAPYSTPTGFNPNPYLSPNTNPYMNPFINPYMMNGSMPMGQDTMGLYMLNALQQGNGIGSGKLGGPRATLAGRASARAKAAKPAPEEPENVSNVPGGSAGKYFGRTNPTRTGAVRYYNRQIRH